MNLRDNDFLLIVLVAAIVFFGGIGVSYWATGYKRPQHTPAATLAPIMHAHAARITGRRPVKPPAQAIEIPAEKFAAMFCRSGLDGCNVRGVYIDNFGPNGMILLPDTYGMVGDHWDEDYARAVLVHEQTHHLQATGHGGLHADSDECVKSEGEAYDTQRKYLISIGRNDLAADVANDLTIFFLCGKGQ